MRKLRLDILTSLYKVLQKRFKKILIDLREPVIHCSNLPACFQYKLYVLYTPNSTQQKRSINSGIMDKKGKFKNGTQCSYFFACILDPGKYFLQLGHLPQKDAGRMWHLF